MDPRTRSDALITHLADAQHGVVARRQLLAAGVSGDAVRGRLRRGLLLPLHRGVYAVGHRRLTREGRRLAAVLAAGSGAVLSHRDAGELHGLGQWSYGRFEVTTVADVDSTSGIRVFARRRLATEDVTVVDAIPVTSVARTLVDLAELLHHDRLLDVLTEAERTQQFDLHALRRALDRVGHRPGPGHGRLLTALAELRQRGLQLTRSELEIALRRLVRDQRLPPAQLNPHDDVVRRQPQTAAKIRAALARATPAR